MQFDPDLRVMANWWVGGGVDVGYWWPGIGPAQNLLNVIVRKYVRYINKSDTTMLTILLAAKQIKFDLSFWHNWIICPLFGRRQENKYRSIAKQNKLRMKSITQIHHCNASR